MVTKQYNPLISVMVPTYNQAAYIQDAVASVLEQTYKNIEVVIADDCSTDATAEKVRPFLQDPRVRYVRNPQNLGRVENYRMTLYERTHGEWVINIDGDDVLTDPSYFASAVSIAEENKHIALIYARRGVLGRDNTSLQQAPVLEYKNLSGDSILFHYWNKNYQLNHLTALYKRSLAVSVGFYQSDIISSDFESLLKLLPKNRIIYYPHTVAMWRRHTENISADLDITKRFSNISYVDNVYRYLKENNYYSPFLRNYWRTRMLYYRIRSTVAVFIQRGKKSDLYKLWKMVIKKYGLIGFCASFDVRNLYHFISSLNVKEK